MSIYRTYADACIERLQKWYDADTGFWRDVGWWNTANILEAVIDYAALTQTNEYDGKVIANTFEKTRVANSKNNKPDFENEKYDDQLWFCLTWIKAFDLTRNKKYLEMAQEIFKNTKPAKDDMCGGGVWWSKTHDGEEEHKDVSHKNTITNALFLTAAARLYLRTDDSNYLEKWALPVVEWFLEKSGLYDTTTHLFYDHLDFDCVLVDTTPWTYNQGVILGGLADLYRSTENPEFLMIASRIAAAALSDTSPIITPRGILQEPAERSIDDGDVPQFKGIFIRYLAYFVQTLTRAYGAHANNIYSPVITKAKQCIYDNVTALWGRSRTPENTFGYYWDRRCDKPDAMRQGAALDAFNAALVISTI